MPEQRKAARFIIDRLEDTGGAALFSEQGSGKTIVTLAIFEELELDNILIVAPLTALEVTWGERLRKMGYSVFKHFEKFREATGTGNVLLIHFQLFAKISKRLAKYPWQIVVIDESQGLKSRSSGWSRAARRMRNAERRLVLSGTPIDESPIDVWGQMRFVDHTVLGEDWTPFASEYCKKGGFKNKKWFFDDRKLDQFLEILDPYIYRLSIDFLDLPPVNVHLIETLILGRQRRVYEEMDEHSMVRIEGIRIRAPLAITKKVKKEEITGGFIKTEEGEVIKVGSAKLRKLKWLVRHRLRKPIVIFCKYTHEIDAIVEAISPIVKTIKTLHGKVKDRPGDKQRTSLIKQFQRGGIDCLVCQLRTGGVSIEFTRSSNLVFYSMNHSFIDFSQIIARLRRYGQNRVVDVFLIYGKNTVDEEIIDIVDEKASSVYRIVSHFEKEE